MSPFLRWKILFLREIECDFPLFSESIAQDTEVMCIYGLMVASRELREFAQKGGKIIFIVSDVEKIRSFLHRDDGLDRFDVTIICDNEREYRTVVHQIIQKRCQFVGECSLQAFLQEYSMILSEYGDTQYHVLHNIQMNVLHARVFVHGETLKDAYFHCPALICGSGPSLDRCDMTLAQSRFLIFAAGSSIPKLVQRGISFDAAVLIDPNPPISLYESIDWKEKPLFYQNRVNSRLLFMHRGPKIWMGSSYQWPIEEWIYQKLRLMPFFFESGWNAGSFAFHIAYFLGCNPIYTTGIDGGGSQNLDAGVRWIQQFQLSHPDRKYGQYDDTLHDCRSGLKRKLSFSSYIFLKRKRVSNILSSLYRDSVYKETQLLFQKLARSPTESDVHREVFIWEAMIQGTPLSSLLIDFLWKILSFFYDNCECSMLMKAIFAKKVIQDFRQEHFFYPCGAIYALQSRRSLFLFYKTGELKAYLKNFNEYMYVYAKNGTILREGRYCSGKKEGMHILREENGEEILRAHFCSDRLQDMHGIIEGGRKNWMEDRDLSQSLPTRQKWGSSNVEETWQVFSRQKNSCCTLFVYGFSLCRSLMEWLEKEERRKVVFLEDRFDVWQEACRTTCALHRRLFLRFRADQENLEAFLCRIAREFFDDYAEIIHFRSDEEQYFLIRQILFQKINDERIHRHVLQNCWRLSESFEIESWKNFFEKMPAIILQSSCFLSKKLLRAASIFSQKALLLSDHGSTSHFSSCRVAPHFVYASAISLESTSLFHDFFRVPLCFSCCVHPRIFHTYCGPIGYVRDPRRTDLERWLEGETRLGGGEGIFSSWCDRELSDLSILCIIAAHFGCNPILFVEGPSDHKRAMYYETKEGRACRDVLHQMRYIYPDRTIIYFRQEEFIFSWQKLLRKNYAKIDERITRLAIKSSLSVTQEEIKDCLTKFYAHYDLQ